MPSLPTRAKVAVSQNCIFWDVATLSGHWTDNKTSDTAKIVISRITCNITNVKATL